MNSGGDPDALGLSDDVIKLNDRGQTFDEFNQNVRGRP